MSNSETGDREAVGLSAPHISLNVHREAYTRSTYPTTHTQGGIYRWDTYLHTQGGIYRVVYPTYTPGRHIHGL